MSDIVAHQLQTVVPIGAAGMTPAIADKLARTIAVQLRKSLCRSPGGQAMTNYEQVNEEVANRWPGWVAVRPLYTRADYNDAVAALDRLAGFRENSAEENLFVVLTALVSAWRGEQQIED